MTIQLPPEFDLPDVDSMVDRIVAAEPARRSGWPVILVALLVAAVGVGWSIVANRPDNVAIPLESPHSSRSTPGQTTSAAETPTPQPTEPTPSTSMAPSMPVETVEPSTSAPSTTEPPTETTVRQVAGAGFVTPSGRIACVMSSSGVRCDLQRGIDEENLWNLPADRGGCQLGGWGSTLKLNGTSALGCTGDTIRPNAQLQNNLYPQDIAWWDANRDLSVDSDTGPLAGLPYGQTLQSGSIQCSSESVGVTCTNLDTGSGFFISRESYQLF